MQHVTAQGLADGTRVGVMPIRRHAFWRVTTHIGCLRTSKRLAASIFLFSAPHRVNQVAIPIDGSREIAQKHLSKIAQAQRVAQPPQHNEQDDINGVFDSSARFSWFVLW
jgi:hypothetical protein